MVCACIMVRAVCSIPKFRQQQAPGLSEPREVMAHVLEHCPKVFPSYMRLEEDFRLVVRRVLEHDFNLQQFLDVESPPACLTVLKELVKVDEDSDDSPEEAKDRLFISMASCFLSLAGSMAGQSQEGSLYVTEARFAKIRMATESIRLLEEDASETEVYNKLLERRVKACETLEPEKPESRAVARLICLTEITHVLDAANISNALTALGKEDRLKMIRHLTADGITQRPAFAAIQATEFLLAARNNPEIGLQPAIRILFRVFEAASQEFEDSLNATIRIRLADLAKFAADFAGSAKFQDVPFELKKIHGCEAVVIPKTWIPVVNQTVLKSLQDNAFRFCSEVSKMPEVAFKGSIARIYPELAYFGPNSSVLKDQTICAMLCVFWLLTGQHEAFISCQPTDEQLSRQSWAWIQDWLQKTVKLKSAEALDATLTFMAIHALGKFAAFRDDLVHGFAADRHDLALAQILEVKPEVVPSFYRMSQKYQQLILDCLRVDFQFSQFLQGENTAANLVMVKDKLDYHGKDGISFFLFRIFAQMCGRMGPQSLSGSLFMNDRQFTRCTPGLKALQQLCTLDGEDAYNEFMLLRGSKAMSSFASPEHQALSRLLCLFEAHDKEEGRSICDAFDALVAGERARLTKWLNADGVQRCPGYTIEDAAQMLKNAKENRHVGLVSALRMMLKVAQECLKYGSVENPRVVVHFDKIAIWAKECSSQTGGFLQASLTFQSKTHADAKVVFVDVKRPTPGAAPVPEVIVDDEPVVERTAPAAEVPETITGSGPAVSSQGKADSTPPSAVPSLDGTSGTTVTGGTGFNLSEVSGREPVPNTSPLPSNRTSTSPLLRTPDTATGSQGFSDSETLGPGPPTRRVLPIGLYGLTAVAVILLILAACVGDASIAISWRQMLIALLIAGLVTIILFMRSSGVEIPVENINMFGLNPEDGANRDRSVTSLRWAGIADYFRRSPGSSDWQYDQLRTEMTDEEAV